VPWARGICWQGKAPTHGRWSGSAPTHSQQRYQTRSVWESWPWPLANNASRILLQSLHTLFNSCYGLRFVGWLVGWLVRSLGAGAATTTRSVFCFWMDWFEGSAVCLWLLTPNNSDADPAGLGNGAHSLRRPIWMNDVQQLGWWDPFYRFLLTKCQLINDILVSYS
jgi:hypothetical protein